MGGSDQREGGRSTPAIPRHKHMLKKHDHPFSSGSSDDCEKTCSWIILGYSVKVSGIPKKWFLAFLKDPNRLLKMEIPLCKKMVF